MCTKFELRVGANDIVTVACDHHISFDATGLKQLQAVLSEYELVHRAAPAQKQAEVVDFDAWMRARTNAAHSAYMAGHAAGGINYRKGELVLHLKGGG